MSDESTAGWRIAADDRTGALDLAAELVPAVGPVTVTVGPTSEGPVVDLDTRHRSEAEAIDRTTAHERTCTGWRAHKIDSMLRGHWAAELRARAAVLGRRIVVLPAWPAMGRTCRGGVVEVHGEPAGRPAALLGADEVVGADALEAWLAGGAAAAVCDVTDEHELGALAVRLAAVPEVLVAGPAGAIGAVVRARSGGAVTPPASAVLEPPVIVVCGSASAVAREQVERLRARVPEVEILVPAARQGPLDRAVATVLADSARERIAALRARTVVVVGGDTAAALLGEGPRVVGGSVARGVPWSRAADGSGPLVVTKAGAFGGPDLLADLLADRPLPSAS
ncbi:MAG: hypothetical protein MUE78_08190 [Ilumatobacteraceae bacterium]|nr:hypothetical protein [Ilumatobacteraceae bacterium]